MLRVRKRARKSRSILGSPRPSCARPEGSITIGASVEARSGRPVDVDVGINARSRCTWYGLEFRLDVVAVQLDVMVVVEGGSGICVKNVEMCLSSGTGEGLNDIW